VILLALLLQAGPAGPAPYRDPSLPVERRVQDLLSRLTPEEKFWQLYMTPGDRDDPAHDWSHGAYGLQISPRAGATTARAQAERINAIQRYFVDSTRLGIPIIPFDEVLHGLAREEAASFPQAIALAATWDTVLMGQVATAIAAETRSRGIRHALSPVINLASDVRWGRTEETYGEDPFLSGEMGVAFIAPFERAGVVTTPKHLVANVGEGGRDSYPIEWNRRELEERFFPPFAEAFRRGHARSVMSAYNSVDGLPATQNPFLLTTKLRHDWHFTGVAISDAAATGGATVLQMTEMDTPSAAEHAWEAGLDVVFQSTWGQHRPYLAAIQRGMVATSVVDSAVARVLRLKFALGLFDDPYVDPAAAEARVADPGTRLLARRAAAASIVLLKNDRDRLPLSTSLPSIAVVGVDAKTVRLGGYSGPGRNVTSILDGIRAALPRAAVRYAEGPGRVVVEQVVIPGERLTSDGKQGLRGEYWNTTGIDLATTPPTLTRQDPTVDFAWTLGTPGPEFPNDRYTARWTGSVTAAPGLTRLGVEGDDGYRLWIDDSLVIDRWRVVTHRTTVVPVRFAAGSRHKLRLEFHTGVPNARVKLVWNAWVDRGASTRIQEAIALARQSRVAVVVAGIEEGEFRDRAFLGLPGRQEELIRAVAATGTPTVVVLVGGSAITMPWLDQVDAVLDAWYPGEAGGEGVADVLFGKEEPGGRLPITFPRSEGQLPLYYDHRPTGRGDDYLDSTGEPLFPFGHGLTYTTFRYGELTLSRPTMHADDTVTVAVSVTNTGRRAGTEVVQLYLHDEVASTSRPVLQLRGFARLALAPGETREARFPISRADLQMYVDGRGWIVEPGTFRLMAGSSARDLHAHATLTVE
jgi:beta-glucosidase